MSEERCDTCRFYLSKGDPDNAGVVIGDCRRYPPVYVVDSRFKDSEPKFPYMQGDEWCGEYQPATI